MKYFLPQHLHLDFFQRFQLIFFQKVLTYISFPPAILSVSDINSDLNKILNFSKCMSSSRYKLHEKSFHIISPTGK